jgi:hypothetical protein
MGWFRGRVAHGASASSATVEALDAGLAHQPGDPFVVDRDPQAEGEFGVHPRPPVRAA